MKTKAISIKDETTQKQRKEKTSLKPSSLSEQIYRSLKRDIIRCYVLPGEQIQEKSVTQQYGVSRTPVREALRRLIQDGLVTLDSGVRYEVTPITVGDIHEVYYLRALVEGEAAALATPRIPTSSITKLEGLLNELLVKKSSEDDETYLWRYLETNNEFHMIIADASGNRRLAKLIESLLEEASRYIYLESIHVGRRGIDGSLKVVKAMEEGDVDATRRLMRDHIRATHKLAVETIISGEAGTVRLNPTILFPTES